MGVISIARCKARPAVYIVWGGVSLLARLHVLAIPKVATKELAPKEDQGVIFGIITAPANATIDDTIRYADAAGKVFQDIPDTRFTFQITFPDNGFGGMVLKPWGVRKTPTKALSAQWFSRNLAPSRRFKCFRSCREALPGSDNFPVSFVIASTARPGTNSRVRQGRFSSKAMQAHVFQFGDIDTKIDQPQAQIVFDHDKVSAHGPRYAAGRRRSLCQHRRKLCQPVQHGRPAATRSSRKSSASTG